MQQRKAPTGLKAILKREALNVREVARDAKIPESTLHYWARTGSIPKRHRALLAQVIGCSEQELLPNIEETRHTPLQEYQMVYEKMDRFFTFGPIETKEIILDGDGVGMYLPEHIQTHYNPVPLELPEEFQKRKDRIAEEQRQNKINGDPVQWNGERYNLAKFRISRDYVNEDMTLDLWFRPSDYYTFLATSKSVQDPAIREKYLAGVEWDEALPLFAHSFSVLLTVLTADGFTILVQRGKGLGCRPNVFDVSVAEGLSRSLDRSPDSQAPNVYRAVLRGLAEELGLHAPADFSAADIQLLSFAVDTEYCMWGLFGLVKLEKPLVEVMQKGARDQFFENRQLFHMPFTPEEICAFVFEHEPFSPGGLVCLYHALVHEFGHEQVNAAISAHS